MLSDEIFSTDKSIYKNKKIVANADIFFSFFNTSKKKVEHLYHKSSKKVHALLSD